MNGLFVISLDFEMMWGVKDVHTPQGYGQTHVKQVPMVVDRLLDLFDRYGVHATFATVGLIMQPSKQETLAHIPQQMPTYDDASLSPYVDDYIAHIAAQHASLYFAPDIIHKLQSHPNIEIGTHTYCHYNCWATGQTVEQFDADLTCAEQVAAHHGITLRSMVFPRNEVTPEHLEICRKHGIIYYRGCARKYFNQPKNSFDNMRQRFLRLADNYFNVGGYMSTPLKDINTTNGMVDVIASRFLRPYNHRLAFADRWRLRRIKHELTHAAREGELYHLWWHPHNFGADTEQNLAFLEQILQHYAQCRQQYAMQPCTMGEAAEIILNQRHDQKQ